MKTDRWLDRIGKHLQSAFKVVKIHPGPLNSEEEILKKQVEALDELPYTHVYTGEEPNRRQKSVIIFDEMMNIRNKKVQRIKEIQKESKKA